MTVPLLQAYQVFKARASGADAILLIAAVLPNSDMNYLIKSARSVGLQCLIEVGSGGVDEIAWRPGVDGCGCCCSFVAAPAMAAQSAA